MQVLRRRVPWLLTVTFLLACAYPLTAAAPPDLEEQTRRIAAELRCVVCQNLSVADSPSEMAQQMRAIVREQLEAGKTPEQVKEFFVSKYGEWVLLKPRTTGLSALLWILPFVALVLGVILALWVAWRWAAAKQNRAKLTDAPAASDIHKEFLAQDFERPDLEDTSPRATLLRERVGLVDERNELEFDFQSGKLSEADYRALEHEIETKAAVVAERLRALPPEPRAAPRGRIQSADKAGRTAAPERARLRRWQLVSGAVFFVAFGIALGVMLSQSVRPRLSESDTMTGDFLTGTTSTNSTVRAALAEGKTAFAHQEFPKAIEAFKKVLSAEPDNPEAHSYMGYILLQAGHADGALMAFERALSRAPDLPMALWGKGMVLYQGKKDFAAAHETFARLLSLVPPGEERNEIVKVLAEIKAAGGGQDRPTKVLERKASQSAAEVSGRITIAAALESKAAAGATLFIIARSAGGGPPLAVKKIERPKFPLDYTLSQENVMMQGTPFTGKVSVTVRLDKDGDPVTRGSGDLAGEYKKNPVDVGAKNVDIVIDRVMP